MVEWTMKGGRACYLDSGNAPASIAVASCFPGTFYCVGREEYKVIIGSQWVAPAGQVFPIRAGDRKGTLAKNHGSPIIRVFFADRSGNSLGGRKNSRPSVVKNQKREKLKPPPLVSAKKNDQGGTGGHVLTTR